MANEEGTTAQSQQINTSQPTPIKGLALKGIKRPETVKCLKPGAEGEDGTIMIVNKADYNEKKHGALITGKLPTRKKKAKKKTTAAVEEATATAQAAAGQEE